LRPPIAVRVVRIVVPVAFIGVVGTAVAAASWPGEPAQIAYPAPVTATTTDPSLTSGATLDQARSLHLSRERARLPLTPTPTPSKKKTPAKKKSSKPKSKPSRTPSATPVKYPTPKLDVTGSKYATAALNIRTVPAMDSRVITVVARGTKLSVTKSVHNGFRFVSYQGKGRWVRNQYLSDSKPKSAESTSSGISSKPCPGGSQVENGLTQDAIRVHRALCARFPAIRSFGGRRASGGFHGTGQALDVMISGSAGWDVAHWVRANAKRLGVSEVLYSQKIWTVQRSSEGWRSFSDRGSATANHYDHVHVSVYGNRGTG
jgi:hypothetical protein